MTVRSTLMRAGALSAVALLALPAQARERSHISPYLEVDQSLVARLAGGPSDVLTYTDVAAGVDMGLRGQRVEAQMNVRYQHSFSWKKGDADSDAVSGVARARYQITQRTLSIEAGAFGTRVRTDGATGANGALVSGDDTSHVYSAYAGPTLTTQVGDLSVNAAYRAGYTRVNDGATVMPDGREVAGKDESVNHQVTASVGMQPGALPVGWSVGAGYERENSKQFDGRYEDKWARGDVTVPVSQTLAVVGGVGYEEVKASQKGAKIDAAGRYVTDEASRRLLTYDSSALMWDAGVMWRPSPRTSLEARFGKRYDSWTYMAAFNWAASSRSNFSFGIFDRVDSFGRSMAHNLSSLPTEFTAVRNPFSGDLMGCVAGSSGGVCFNDQLAGISSLNYRHRGANAQYSQQAGVWMLGLGLGYSQRKYLAPNTALFAAYAGRKDENWFGTFSAGRPLDESSNIQANLYGNLFQPGLGLDTLNLGSNVTYSRNFGRRLSANASVGVDAIKQDTVDTQVNGMAQLGMRYQF